MFGLIHEIVGHEYEQRQHFWTQFRDLPTLSKIANNYKPTTNHGNFQLRENESTVR